MGLGERRSRLGIEQTHADHPGRFGPHPVADVGARFVNDEWNDGGSVEVGDHRRCSATRSLTVPLATMPRPARGRFGTRPGMASPSPVAATTGPASMGSEERATTMIAGTSWRRNPPSGRTRSECPSRATPKNSSGTEFDRPAVIMSTIRDAVRRSRWVRAFATRVSRGSPSRRRPCRRAHRRADRAHARRGCCA